MREQISNRVPDASMTLPLACLLSAASVHTSISTGKERDTESGNDYFGARYYASSMGRFLSPDWSAQASPVPYAKMDNPQTLNLYSYMRNNPLGGSDPDGHCGQQQSGVTSCPNVTVTANSQPKVLTNVAVGGQKLSGVGTTTTITLTNQNGTPAANVPVKESPSTTTTATVDGKTSTHTDSGSITNPNSVNTSADGKMGDIVMQPATNKPVGPNEAITPQDIADVQAGVPLTKVTTQTLTFPGQGCTCQARYSQTLTNVGPNGSLNPTNSTGTNFTFTITTPVVTKKDQ